MAKEFFLKYVPEAVTLSPAHKVCSIELPESDPDGSHELRFFYSQIGCEDIEIVRSQQLTKMDPSGLMMIVDGCFLCHDNLGKVNPIASALAGQYILGNALIGRLGDRNGEPDIIGFDAEADAEEVAATVREWLTSETLWGWAVV